MGRNDYYTREIRRLSRDMIHPDDEDATPAGATTRRRAATPGGEGGPLDYQPDGLDAIESIFAVPDAAKASREAQMAYLGELLGPQYAREHGVSEDQAREAITGGIRPQQPGWKEFAQGIGLMDQPEGERYSTRIARLGGMYRREPREEAYRQSQIGDIGKLIDIARKTTHPEALTGTLSDIAKRGGLGDVRLEPEQELAGNEVELLQRHPELYDRYMKDQIEARRTSATRGGGKMTELERAIGSLDDPDPRVATWAHTKLGLVPRAGFVRDPRAAAMIESQGIDRMAAAEAAQSDDPEVAAKGKAAMAKLEADYEAYVKTLPNGGWVAKPQNLPPSRKRAEAAGGARALNDGTPAGALVDKYVGEVLGGDQGGAPPAAAPPSGSNMSMRTPSTSRAMPQMTPTTGWEARHPHIRDSDPELWGRLGQLEQRDLRTPSSVGVTSTTSTTLPPPQFAPAPTSTKRRRFTNIRDFADYSR